MFILVALKLPGPFERRQSRWLSRISGHRKTWKKVITKMR